jgi:succinyl-CoA synthetase beta subunit
MNIHEYQGKSILSQFGVTVQRGYVATTPEEATAVAESNFSVYPLVTKLAPLGCPQSERLCDYYLA